MMIGRLIGVLIGIVLSIGTGYAQIGYPKDNPEYKPEAVRVIGDSIALGIAKAGGHESIAVEGIGIDRLIREVEGAKDNPRYVPEYTLGITYVSIGTNDYWRGYSIPAYIERLDRLEDTLHSQGYTSVCYLVPAKMPKRIDTGLYNIREALQGRGCTITLPDTLRAKDGIHYRLQGYKQISKLISK